MNVVRARPDGRHGRTYYVVSEPEGDAFVRYAVYEIDCGHVVQKLWRDADGLGSDLLLGAVIARPYLEGNEWIARRGRVHEMRYAECRRAILAAYPDAADRAVDDSEGEMVCLAAAP